MATKKPTKQEILKKRAEAERAAAERIFGGAKKTATKRKGK